MRYARYTAYVCMFGRRGKGAKIPLMGVRFFEIAIPLKNAGEFSIFDCLAEGKGGSAGGVPQLLGGV